MDSSLAVRIAIVAAAALLLGWVFVAYVRRDRYRTEHMIDPVLAILESPRIGRSSWDYEFAEGLFDGRPARMSLLPDTLITRTLPTLWLEVRWALPAHAFLCIIVDRNGMEYFADEVDEGTPLVTPAEWPASLMARGKGPQSAALARRLRHLDLSSYRGLKLLTFTEKEVKVIMRCARGEVSYYRVLRSANFPEDCVKPELVAETARVLRDIERVLGGDEEAA